MKACFDTAALIGVRTVRLPKGLQFFAESANADELAELEAAVDELSRKLTGSPIPEHREQRNRIENWRLHKLRDNEAGKPTSARSFYKILRENGGADLAAVIRKKYHPDSPAAGMQRPMITVDVLDEWMRENGFRVRLDLVSHRIEVDGIPDGDLRPEQIDALFPAYIHDAIKQTYRSNVAEIGAAIQILAGRESFNPVLEKLAAAPAWDGRDRLSELYEIIGIQDDDLSRTLVLKWLLQCVALQYNSLTNPFGADGCLVLVGRQGIGKTSLFRKLAVCVDSRIFGEGVLLSLLDKDSKLCATSKWICELGELDGTLRRSDIAPLKAFMTDIDDEIRRPYAAASEQTPRRTSFCASVNETTFLVDPTENRRFWTVPVDNIDLDRLRRFDALQLWRQVYDHVERLRMADASAVQGCFRLSKTEQAALNERNSGHAKPLYGEDEIRDIIAKADVEQNRFEWRFITLTEFLKEHDLRLSVNKLRPAIDRIMNDDSRIELSTSIDGKRGKFIYLPMWKSSFTSVYGAPTAKKQ